MLTIIDGTPAWANSEKSSLVVFGGDVLILSPNTAFKTFSAVATTAGAFMTPLLPSVILISGAGASDIAAAAFAVRSMPANIFARTWGLNERMGPRTMASSGVIFPAVAEWSGAV